MREWKNDQFPRDGQSGHGEQSGFSLEARHNYGKPIKIGGQIFDREWRRVQVFENDLGIGIPRRKYLSFVMRELGLLTWKEANAHRWYLYCLCEQENGMSLCLETGIVEHEITYDYKTTITRAYDPMGGDDFGGATERPMSKPTWPAESEEDAP